MKALAPDDYPALPMDNRGTDEGEVSIEVGASEIAGSLSQVVRAASSDESRQILTGVLWEIESGSLTLAATDSYRLSVRSLEVKGGAAEARNVVVPARTLGELARSLTGRGGSVSTLVKENLIVFSIKGDGDDQPELLIGSRFIEGEFPKYRQLIPEGYPNALTVERDKLLEVVKRVGLLAQNNMPVKFHLAAELEISAHTPDVGEGQEVLEAQYEGEEFVIAFNPAFLSDGASAIQHDKLVLEAGDGLKPAILKGEGDASFTYLLMPVRLS